MTGLRRRAALAPVLAAVAGYVDAVSYLSLNVFTAHMSGNSARLGVYLSQDGFHEALVVSLAVLVFVLSVGIGTLLMEIGVRQGWRATESVLLTIEALLLLAFAVAGGVAQVGGLVPLAPAARFYGLVACAVAAIGLQTASLQRISGQTVRTTYVSGMLTSFADHAVAALMLRRAQPDAPSYVGDELGLRQQPHHAARMVLVASVWIAYVGGAVAGAFAHGTWQLACLGIPIGVLLLVAAASWAASWSGSGGTPQYDSVSSLAG